MVVGFTSRSQTVSEGSQVNRLTIDVATARTSEKVFTFVFRYLRSRSTAIVQSYVIQRNLLFDALFSNAEGSYLAETFTLQPGQSEIPSLITSVRNDFHPEDEECYTIAIAAVSPLIYFSCYDDYENGNYFFCLHTVCITDDDGILHIE